MGGLAEGESGETLQLTKPSKSIIVKVCGGGVEVGDVEGTEHVQESRRADEGRRFS